MTDAYEAEASPIDRLKTLRPEARSQAFDPENLDLLGALWVDDRQACEEVLEAMRRNHVRRVDQIEAEVKKAARKHRAANAKVAEQADGDDVVYPSNSPLLAAQRFQEHFHPTLIHFNDDWLEHSGNHYRELESNTIKRDLYGFLAPLNPDRKKVGDVADALQAVAHRERSQFDPPCWLDPQPTDPAANEILSLTNGLLHLPTQHMMEQTPRFFTRNGLDFEYDPLAPLPGRWLQFLRELWPDSPESVDALQEMFGYLLAPDTSLQKIFMIVGPKRCGKGTIGRILIRLLGAGNCCAQTMQQLSTQFGMQSMIGTQLAVVSDMRITQKTDTGQAAENLLRISGEDYVTVQRKYKTDWYGRLATRFLLLTNVPPIIPDMSGALANRYVPLVIRESFFGKEDTELTEKLYAELPGILAWSVDGWKRLKRRGYFVLTEGGREIVREISARAAPISAFLEERCILERGAQIATQDLHEAFDHWASSIDGLLATAMSDSDFGRQLLVASGQRIRKTRPRIGGIQTPHYAGVRLRRAEEEEMSEG